MERLRAVAQETKKWEEREARWVKRFQELGRSGSDPTAGLSTTSPRSSPAAVAETAMTEGVVSPRYVGGGYGCGPGKQVSFADPQTDSSCHRVHRGVDSDIHRDERDTGDVIDRQFTATPCVVSPTAAMYSGLVNSHSVRTSGNAPAFIPASVTLGSTPTSVSASQQGPGGGEAMEPVSTLAAAPLDALSVALLAQQLPSLPNFNGEILEGDGESFNSLFL